MDAVWSKQHWHFEALVCKRNLQLAGPASPWAPGSAKAAVLLGSRFLLVWEAAPTSSSSASLGTLKPVGRKSLAWHRVKIARPWLRLSLGVLFPDPWNLFSPAWLQLTPSVLPAGAVTACDQSDQPILVLICGKRKSMAARYFLGVMVLIHKACLQRPVFLNTGWRKQQETIFLHNPRSFFPASTKHTRRV